MVVLDMGDIPAESTRRVPLTSWFRFRRAVEPTSTVLLLVEQEACAKTCASLVMRLQRQRHLRQLTLWQKNPSPNLGWRVVSNTESAVPANNAISHAALLHGMQFEAEVAALLDAQAGAVRAFHASP